MTFGDVKRTVKAALAGEEFDADDLARVLNLAKKVYYNSGDNLPEKVVEWFETKITDSVFDELEDLLREEEPNHKYFKNNTGAPVAENKSTNASMRKTRLPVPMPSLDKVKPDSRDLGSFLAKGPFVVSAKVDGVSLLILTKTKKLYTRGNGTIGQDISYLWNDLSLPPNPKGDYTIRGEMVIPKELFEKYKKAFGKKGADAKNARNSMSGLVNSGSSSPLFKHVKVLTYMVLDKKPSDAFPLMEKLGFDTPFWKEVSKLNLEKCNELLKKVKSLPYEADGLVIARDVVERPTTSNPENTVAFKNNAIADTKVFKVKEVIWQPSKHGKLKPVLSLEPQNLDGVTISKCTAFNGEYVQEHNLGPGALIKLVRSGGVIPHVLEVVKEAPHPQMPDELYTWDGADIYVTDKDENAEVAIKKIAFFFKHLGAEGISKKFFEKLYAEGYQDLKSILKLTRNQLLSLPGVQDKSAKSIYDQIQKVKKASLADYMIASGCFPPTVAGVRINNVLDKFPDIVMERDKAVIFEKVASLSGFSRITAMDFTKGVIAFRKWVRELDGEIHVIRVAKKEAKSSKLKGLIVCPTGFRFDAATKDFIEENGGKVQSSMTNETTLLVTKDLGSGSSKIQKAKAKGIKVMSLEAFKKQISTLGK